MHLRTRLCQGLLWNAAVDDTTFDITVQHPGWPVPRMVGLLHATAIRLATLLVHLLEGAAAERADGDEFVKDAGAPGFELLASIGLVHGDLRLLSIYIIIYIDLLVSWLDS